MVSRGRSKIAVRQLSSPCSKRLRLEVTPSARCQTADGMPTRSPGRIRDSRTAVPPSLAALQCDAFAIANRQLGMCRPELCQLCKLHAVTWRDTCGIRERTCFRAWRACRMKLQTMRKLDSSPRLHQPDVFVHCTRAVLPAKGRDDPMRKCKANDRLGYGTAPPLPRAASERSDVGDPREAPRKSS